MATRKKRRSSGTTRRAKATRRSSSPRRPRRAVARVRHAHHLAHLRTSNPKRRRNTTRRYKRRNFTLFGRVIRRHRRRNPGGMLAKGFVLAGFAALEQLLLMWVPPLGGPSAIADAGRTAGLGVILGWAMKKTGFLARYAEDAQLAGLTLAGGKIITAFILPFANRFISSPKPAQMSGLATWRPGMQPFPVYAPQGYMQGTGTPASTGMQGLAVWQPGMQPFPIYNGMPMA